MEVQTRNCNFTQCRNNKNQLCLNAPIREPICGNYSPVGKEKHLGCTEAHGDQQDAQNDPESPSLGGVQVVTTVVGFGVAELFQRGDGEEHDGGEGDVVGHHASGGERTESENDADHQHDESVRPGERDVDPLQTLQRLVIHVNHRMNDCQVNVHADADQEHGLRVNVQTVEKQENQHADLTDGHQVEEIEHYGQAVTHVEDIDV